MPRQLAQLKPPQSQGSGSSDLGSDPTAQLMTPTTANGGGAGQGSGAAAETPGVGFMLLAVPGLVVGFGLV
jgi:hypothetical protein